jgi:hypothetical protein
MSSDMNRVVELKDQNELTVEFTYSVSWIKTNIPFSKRTQLQAITSKTELEIHWLSILNSFVLVILLTGFIAIIIMRILKSDYSRYARDDEEEGTHSLLSHFHFEMNDFICCNPSIHTHTHTHTLNTH